MRLALIGDPVDHSESPRLHREFLEEADIDGSYVALRVARGAGAGAIRGLRADGYTGCNVTFPLKEEAFEACDVLTEEAERAQAVNTIFFGRQTLGTTTDGIGARSAIEALLEEPVALKRIGILGYGATARAILAELQENDAYTFVWGRDRERVRAVCERFDARVWPIGNVPEIVVSTLPPDASLPDELVAELRTPDLVLDANYGPRATLARRIDREVVTGDAMLEAQARASFDFWLAHLDRVAGEGEENAG
jgi:shikimate dehydrogenase